MGIFQTFAAAMPPLSRHTSSEGTSRKFNGPPLYSHQERQPWTGVVDRPFHLEKINQSRPINYRRGGLGDGRAGVVRYLPRGERLGGSRTGSQPYMSRGW